MFNRKNPNTQQTEMKETCCTDTTKCVYHLYTSCSGNALLPFIISHVNVVCHFIIQLPQQSQQLKCLSHKLLSISQLSKQIHTNYKLTSSSLTHTDSETLIISKPAIITDSKPFNRFVSSGNIDKYKYKSRSYLLHQFLHHRRTGCLLVMCRNISCIAKMLCYKYLCHRQHKHYKLQQSSRLVWLHQKLALSFTTIRSKTR